MTTSSDWKPFALGAVGGAIVLMLLGFTVLGWTPSSTAAADAKTEAEAAVVTALSPICASQFNADTGATANLEQLKTMTSYKQGDFIEKGGWATMPGSEKPVSGVSRGCALLLLPS